MTTLPEPYDTFVAALLGWYDAVESQNLVQANAFADRVLVAGRRLAAEPQFVNELEQHCKGADAARLLAGMHAFLRAFNDTMSSPRNTGS